MRRPDPRRLVAQWNRRVPVGQPVLYWPGTVVGQGKLSRTCAQATVLGGHTAVAWLEGERACVALTHVAALPNVAADRIAYDGFAQGQDLWLRVQEVRGDARLTCHEGDVDDFVSTYERMVATVARRCWDGRAAVYEWMLVECKRCQTRRGRIAFDAADALFEGRLLFDRSDAQIAANPFRVEAAGRPDMPGSVRAMPTCELACCEAKTLSVRHQSSCAVYCCQDFVGHVYSYSGRPRTEVSNWGWACS